MRHVFLILIIAASFAASAAFAEEPRFSTYHEVATVLVDQKISNNVTASVALQTTSLKEFQVPPELDAKIRNNTDIVAVLITNQDQCVLGVQDQICVMVNVKRVQGEGGIKAAQEKAKLAGDSLISDINSAFDLKTKFHSVFIHYDDKTNQALDTGGDVSGAGTVSAVYTAPMQSTDFMYDRISTILIPKQIRSMGGFYNLAKNLSVDDESKMTFAILPEPQGSIMQLKVSKDYPHTARDMQRINPLEYFKTDTIKKSDYFSVGFFPLNSLVHVVILPAGNSTSIHAQNVLDTTIKNGEKIPADLTKNGWFFDESGAALEAIYLFGEGKSAGAQDLTLSLESGKPIFKSANYDETYIIIIIGAASAGAAVFFLRGIKKKN